jgi:hypothetical protein
MAQRVCFDERARVEAMSAQGVAVAGVCQPVAVLCQVGGSGLPPALALRQCSIGLEIHRGPPGSALLVRNVSEVVHARMRPGPPLDNQG